MHRFVRNGIARPFAWAFPIVLMGRLLDVELTWQVLILVLFAVLISDVINTLLPRAE